MEQLDILSIVFFGLAALVLIMGIVFVIVFYKPIGGYDIEFNDDLPARYENYEEAFYNPEI